MDFLKMLKQAKEMQSQMKKVQDELRGKTVEVNYQGLYVLMNGKQEIQNIKISPELLQNSSPEKLEKALQKVFNEAISKTHDLMSGEIKKITGGLNIPGLM